MRDDWDIKTLDELFNIKSSKRVHKADWKTQGIPFYRAREVVKLCKDGYVNNDLFISKELYNNFIKKTGSPKEGDIIISAVGTLGQCYLVKRSDKFYFKDASVLWFEKKSNICTKYIEYAFKSDLIIKQVLNKSMGATVGTLTISRAKIIQIPIPPNEEQKEIVEILDQAFESIEKAKANIEKNMENAKELFQSKLNQIFSQTGEDCKEITIGEIGKVSMCKRILKHQTSQTGEIPFYKIGTFGKVPNSYIDAETFNLFKEKYSYPKIGDVLLSASGTIGRRVIFDGKPAYFQDSNIVWVDNNEEIILNKYLYHFYEFCDWNPSKGATIKRLYNNDLRRIKISYPICLEKQNNIIERIEILNNHIQSLLTSYKEELENLEDLKKSILQKAFSGELTNKNKAA